MVSDNEKEAKIIQKKDIKEISELKKQLPLKSSKSKFEDEKWIMDIALNKQSVTTSVKTLYFTQIQLKYREIIKIFALIRLSEFTDVNTISSNINGIIKFFRFLSENLNDYPLKRVNKKVINAFQEHLYGLTLAKRSKETIWTGVSNLFKSLGGYYDIPKVRFSNNPYSVPRHKRESTNPKYIEEYVLKQLDALFEDEKLPLVFRTGYWICRLIPSRITEVSSMTIGCIKPYINELIIEIPSFKQNGGHIEPEIRQIAIKDEGKGKYLLKLIRQQEEVSKSLQNYMDDDKKNFLFTYFSSQYIPTKQIYKELKGNLNKLAILNESNFNKMLKTMCKRYNVQEEDGKIVNISSHRFRHVGITDRLYEGFRVIDIMSMTNHKSPGMITQSYVHVQNDKLREISKKVLNEEKSEVLFRGKIINANDPNKINRILRRPFSHRIGRLGICSDISNCQSEMFECLKCDNFVPNADELEYFQDQVHQWEKKVNKFAEHPYLKENALYNLRLNKQIVEKIINGTEGMV